MTEVFGFVYAIIKAVPAIRSWVNGFIAWYVETEIKNMREKDQAALRKAVYEQDQRDLEKQLGAKNPGEASHLPGTSIVGVLPNVVPLTPDETRD